MALEKYNTKRDFEKTAEPEGRVESVKGSDLIFVIHKHDASRLHYDLRLEMNGVLKSWAVPKEPPIEEGVRRLAVNVEDHPLGYANFEGTIPEGQYGAGTVEIWDKGRFIPEKVGKDEIIFELLGKKMNGRYVLVKVKPNPRFKGENNWLFFRKKE